MRINAHSGTEPRRRPWAGGGLPAAAALANASRIRHHLKMPVAAAQQPPPPLDSLRDLVGDDWGGVNRVIYRRLGSDVTTVRTSEHDLLDGIALSLR